MTAAGRPGGVSPTARGILWMLLSVLIYVAGDTVFKRLTLSYPLIEVIWARYTFHAILVALLLGRRLPRALATRRPGLQVSRSALQFCSAASFITGLWLMPIAEANAIQFVNPLFVALLSAPLLGERVGIDRWLGVAAGFAGALIIIRPGFGDLALPAMLPLASAGFHAFYQIITRIVSRDDDAMTSLVYAAAVGLVASTLAVPFVWVAPDAEGWALMAAGGTIAACSHLAMIKAFTATPAATVAPYGYTSLVWSIVFGFLAFGDLPDRFTVAGALIIAASGLYIFRVERRRPGSG